MFPFSLTSFDILLRHAVGVQTSVQQMQGEVSMEFAEHFLVELAVGARSTQAKEDHMQQLHMHQAPLHI